MQDLTFAEQVKIILSRKSMTIKELASLIEERTGKKMSRQNLTQRLLRDNFQEQDMRMISAILGCPFTLSILGTEGAPEAPDKSKEPAKDTKNAPAVETKEPVSDTKEGSSGEVEMTIGDLYDMNEELNKLEEEADQSRSPGIFLRKDGVEIFPKKEKKTAGKRPAERRKDSEKESRKRSFEPVIKHYDEEEDLSIGELNPYTGHEYQSNSVRSHPSRIGYVQVYDRKTHKWTDMTEWAFLGYQERKKALLGRNYEPPIYLD